MKRQKNSGEKSTDKGQHKKRRSSEVPPAATDAPRDDDTSAGTESEKTEPPRPTASQEETTAVDKPSPAAMEIAPESPQAETIPAEEEKEEQDLGFWVEKSGDVSVRQRLDREIQQREEKEKRKQAAEKTKELRQALTQQVESAVPIALGSQLSTITVSTYRVFPLVNFAPPSTSIHTLLIRMQPNERLCFHGRVHIRVLEGCAHIFGHQLHPSEQYYTLSSSFSSGALCVEAVNLTEATPQHRMECERLENIRQQTGILARPSRYSPRTSTDGCAYQLSDEEIRNILTVKRRAEDERQSWQNETVLILRTYYEEPGSRQQSNSSRSDATGGQPLNLPKAPSLATLRLSLASKLFVNDGWETEHRPELVLRAPEPTEPSDMSDSEESDDEAIPEEDRSDNAEMSVDQPVTNQDQQPDTQADDGAATSNASEKQTSEKPESQPQPQPQPQPQLSIQGIVNIFMKMPGFYPLFDGYDRGSVPMHIPKAWLQVAGALSATGTQTSTSSDAPVSSQSPPRVVITGKKSTGKSTISQYLINSLLNSYPFVVYLDADLGQPEFTPAGLVSLHIISSPVFGPSFTHLSTPISSYFLGSVDVEGVIELYPQALRNLVDKYNTTSISNGQIPLSSLPLIINTHGWLKGLGYIVSRDLIWSVAPTHAVHLYSLDSLTGASREDPSIFPFHEEDINCRPRIWTLPSAVRRPRLSLSADEYRVLRFSAYFSSWVEGGLVTQVPYCVPWNAVRIGFIAADVPPSECFFALNASLVGLCSDNTQYLSCAPPGQKDLSRGQSYYPSILLSTPLLECAGLGIVRTIDPVTHQFYVLTPIKLGELQRVNTFVKGALSLPVQALAKAGWLSNPYVMTEAITKAGGAKMTGRTTLLRKHTSG